MQDIYKKGKKNKAEPRGSALLGPLPHRSALCLVVPRHCGSPHMHGVTAVGVGPGWLSWHSRLPRHTSLTFVVGVHTQWWVLPSRGFLPIGWARVVVLGWGIIPLRWVRVVALGLRIHSLLRARWWDPERGRKPTKRHLRLALVHEGGGGARTGSKPHNKPPPSRFCTRGRWWGLERGRNRLKSHLRLAFAREGGGGVPKGVETRQNTTSVSLLREGGGGGLNGVETA